METRSLSQKGRLSPLDAFRRCQWWRLLEGQQTPNQHRIWCCYDYFRQANVSASLGFFGSHIHCSVLFRKKNAVCVCVFVAEFFKQTTCHIGSTKWAWMLGSAQYGGQVSKSECVSVCVRLKSSHAHSVRLKASLDNPFTTLLHVVLHPMTPASAVTLFLVALCLRSHCSTEVLVKANIFFKVVFKWFSHTLLMFPGFFCRGIGGRSR